MDFVYQTPIPLPLEGDGSEVYLTLPFGVSQWSRAHSGHWPENPHFIPSLLCLLSHSIPLLNNFISIVNVALESLPQGRLLEEPEPSQVGRPTLRAPRSMVYRRCCMCALVTYLISPGTELQRVETLRAM